MSSGVVLPYLNLYFKKIGLSGKQIGMLSSLGMFCMFLAPPLWSIIDDSHNKRGRLLSLLIAASAVCFFTISFSISFLYLIPIILIFNFFYSPLLPLSDAIALEYVDQAKKETFGSIRLWGTIGYMVAAVAIGWFINTDYLEIPERIGSEIALLSERTAEIDLPQHIESGIRDLDDSLHKKNNSNPAVLQLPVRLLNSTQLLGERASEAELPEEIDTSIGRIVKGLNKSSAAVMKPVFYGFILVMAGTLFFSFLLPKEHVRSKRPALIKIGELFANRNLTLFFIVTFFFGAASTASMLFLSIYLDTIGASGALIGYSRAIAASFEIIILLVNKKIMDRIGIKWLIIIGMIASSLRWFLCSITHNPYLALPIQMLQSLSFVALFVGAITFVFRETPAAFRTTGQFIYRSIGSGLGPIFGMLFGGYMLDTFGIFKMYQITSLAIILTALFMILFIKEPVVAETVESNASEA